MACANNLRHFASSYTRREFQENPKWDLGCLYGDYCVIKERGDQLDKLLLKQGFTFNVVCDRKEEKCQLIKLNSFGMRSGCRTCFFIG
jgi:hypothetical protein